MIDPLRRSSDGRALEQWPAVAAPTTTLAPAATESSSIDYRLWLGAGRASFGVGLASVVAVAAEPALAGAPHATSFGGSSMIVGVRYQLNDRSGLYVDAASLGDRLPIDRDVRMGFEFKSAPNTALNIARGTLFRVQWSSQSHVSLRLRSGGVQLALRSKF